MTIVEIIAYENNSHRNQCGNFKTIPEGWAVVPDDLETPNFPFGIITVEEIDGVMTVTQWTACPCPEPEDMPKLVNSIDLSSYYAFCANAENDTNGDCLAIDCAFGKNNEDRIMNLGLQLAMYSWFCGDSKTEYPFTELCKCCTLTDIENNHAAFEELWGNSTLRDLYMRGSDHASYRNKFPHNRVMSQLTTMSTENVKKTVNITNNELNETTTLWYVADGTIKDGSYRFYLNDVLLTEITFPGGSVALNIDEGKEVKLSEYGIDAPGSYVLRSESTSTKTGAGWLTLYIKTTLE